MPDMQRLFKMGMCPCRLRGECTRARSAMFENRKEAGLKLGAALKAYRECNGLVLAIPRGGAEVGYYAAEHLKLPLSIVVVRKNLFSSKRSPRRNGIGATCLTGK